jgi:beta-mannosidase
MMKHPKTLVLALLSMLSLVGCKQKEPILLNSSEISSDWIFRQADKEEWLPATVPGCVQTDLMKNGKIEDPFYRLNEHDVQWIDKVNWEYKTSFNIDPVTFSRDRIALDFKGLDTYADVYVNDTLVLSGQQPAASSQQPVASSQQPAASSQQPAASSQQPAASSQQPAASS